MFRKVEKNMSTIRRGMEDIKKIQKEMQKDSLEREVQLQHLK